MAKIIDLTKGYFCLVDDEDFDMLMGYKWSYSGGYARRGYKGRTFSIHRQILNLTHSPTPMVDHINGDPLDNRKENLRICDCSKNGANKGMDPNNTTGYRGVSLDGRTLKPSYRATITYKDKQKYLGTYSTLADAARAYNSAAIIYFGEFATLNKIKEEHEP